MEMLCPECNEAMRWLKGNVYSCPVCHTLYNQVCLCPQCQQPLEKLQACGAVNYFCSHGHGLVSKRQVIYRFDPFV